MRAVSAGARAIAVKEAILAKAGRGPESPERARSTSDQRRHGGLTLRHLTLAAFDQARIAEIEVAGCRSTGADLLATLEEADG